MNGLTASLQFKRQGVQFITTFQAHSLWHLFPQGVLALKISISLRARIYAWELATYSHLSDIYLSSPYYFHSWAQLTLSHVK